MKKILILILCILLFVITGCRQNALSNYDNISNTTEPGLQATEIQPETETLPIETVDEMLHGIPTEKISKLNQFNNTITNGVISFIFDENLLYKDIPYDIEESLDYDWVGINGTNLIMKSSIGKTEQTLRICVKNLTNQKNKVQDCNVIDLHFYNNFQWDFFGINMKMTIEDVKNVLGECADINESEHELGHSTRLIYFLENNNNVYSIEIRFIDNVMFDASINLNNTPIIMGTISD